LGRREKTRGKKMEVPTRNSPEKCYHSSRKFAVTQRRRRAKKKRSEKVFLNRAGSEKGSLMEDMGDDAPKKSFLSTLHTA